MIICKNPIKIGPKIRPGFDIKYYSPAMLS